MILTSYLAPFPRYRRVLVKFLLSMEGEGCLSLAHSLGVNPTFRIVKSGLNKLEKTFYGMMQRIYIFPYPEPFRHLDLRV